MRYYKNLYLQDKLEKKRDTVIGKLEAGKYQHDLHLLVLPPYCRHLEILNANLMLQKNYPKEDMLVVGIAKGYDSAMEILEQIVQEVYNKTGDVNVRSYILDKEWEG